jgi:predicted RecA/RadA family phage recombinase
MKNFVSDGRVITVPAPSGGCDSGDGVKVGDLFGIAQVTAAEGAPVAIVTTGVFTLPKTSAQAWTVGAKIYWDDTNKVCTTTATSNKLIGAAVAAAANPSAAGNVLLNVNI